MKRVKMFTALLMALLLMLPAMAYGEPVETVSRLEFIKEVLNTLELNIPANGTSPFNDITEEADIPYVAAAHELNLISGNGGLFRPDASITKEEAIIILTRLLGEVNLVASDEELNFTDSNEIGSWAKPYVLHAVELGILENGPEALNPKAKLTAPELEKLLNQFQSSQIREGLSATEMLVLTEKKLQEKLTYQQKGYMIMDMELTEPSGQSQQLTIDMLMKAYVETPETVYTMVTATTQEGDLKHTEESETFIKDRIAYIRQGEGQEWIKMDMNPLMDMIEGLQGGVQQGIPSIPSDQLEAYGQYAHYSRDAEINGQKYYVIEINIDPASYKELFTQILNQSMDLLFEGELLEQMTGEALPAELNQEEFKAMVKEMIAQTVENTNIHMNITYYINQDTKVYEYFEMSQLMDMDMMGVKMNSYMNGWFEIFGIDEPVSFPQIEE